MNTSVRWGRKMPNIMKSKEISTDEYYGRGTMNTTKKSPQMNIVGRWDRTKLKIDPLIRMGEEEGVLIREEEASSKIRA